MMRITVGVDEPSQTTQALDLIQALKFPMTTLDLTHVVERWDSSPTPRDPSLHLDLIEKYLKMQEDEGEKLLSRAVQDAASRGFEHSEKYLVFGHISNQLIHRSVESKAHLLALGSSGKKPLQGILIGSVTRKATISSPVSVLVAKGRLASLGPLKVVVATDHSPYSHSSLKKWASWNPQGISQLTMVTVFPEEMIRGLTGMVDHFKADIASWMREELQEANMRALKLLEHIPCEKHSRVESGPVSTCLAKVMEEEKADLLVMGAQGHGFIDRLTLGSISLDQVVARPYSVLIMRP